jgi:hypothetical protein
MQGKGLQSLVWSLSDIINLESPQTARLNLLLASKEDVQLLRL